MLEETRDSRYVRRARVYADKPYGALMGVDQLKPAHALPSAEAVCDPSLSDE